MNKLADKLRLAIKYVRLALWILEKILDAIETYPKNTTDSGPSGSDVVVNKEGEPQPSK